MSFLDDPQVRRNVDRLPIEFDDYGFDRFGLSKSTVARAYSPMAHAYRRYLKVTAFGLENVPAEGRALIIANHSGGIGWDAGMILTSLLLNDDAPRLTTGVGIDGVDHVRYSHCVFSMSRALIVSPSPAPLEWRAKEEAPKRPDGPRRCRRSEGGAPRLPLRRSQRYTPFR